MILWDNFDKRQTKVMCDMCQGNVTHAFNQALGDKPHEARLAMQGRNAESMVKQTVFHVGTSKFVLMEFSGSKGKPQGILKTLRQIYHELKRA